MSRAAAISAADGLRLLVAQDGRRLAARLRRSSPAMWMGVVLPVVLLGGVLAAVGSGAVPDPGDAAGGGLLGFMAAAPVSFFAYGALYRGGDRAWIHALGAPAGAVFAHRALRLLLEAAVVGVLLLIPYTAAGISISLPLVILAGAVLASWSLGLLATAGAASATVGSGGPAILRAGLGWDRELARVAPLLYAPLAPLVGGVLAGFWIAATPGAGAGRAAIVAIAGLAILPGASALFTRANPRFVPRVAEMAFEPPATTETALLPHRGIARLLPERVAQVRARDAAVAGRRFSWAQRIVWPVAIVALVAIGRWGHDPTVRSWIVAAAVLTLIAQGVAGVALGWHERHRTRWLDRVLGLGTGVRYLGRWAWAMGIHLWLVVPLAVIWGLWSTQPGWWLWLAGAAVVSALSAGASLLVARA